MGLREQLAEYREPFEAVTRVASCQDSFFFADLCWPPYDHQAETRRMLEGSDPGVIFETTSRVVVVEEHSGELRFYAGGWGNHIYDQPSEMGVFRSPEDAIRYAEAFLARDMLPQQIPVMRGLRFTTDGQGRSGQVEQEV